MNRIDHTAWFRFYEELNDFLHTTLRKTEFPYRFNGSPSVKDATEAIGIPHVEVDMVLVNGVSVDFSYRLHDNDHVSVYPVFESLDITSVTHLREKPLRELRFIADVHLGRLVKYLRLCGFDTYFRNDTSDREIIDLALAEKRIILTRDKGLLRNRHVTHGYWIRSAHPEEQMREIMNRLDLKNQVLLFTRCVVCNGVLTDVTKEEISHRLLPDTLIYFNKFKMCPECHRIYWKGSHYERMKDFIGKLINESDKRD
ncbi:MAG TPA: Mut7-C RNAse domain-containing protein [Bacteroidales bacterium]|nr:Mut7-C RNAse domain-containing protein [Bacteroidales bacterium]